MALCRVKDCMTRELVTARPDMDAHQAKELLLEHQISGMPVVDEAGKLVGVLSERDLLQTLVDAEYHELPTAFVKDLMSTQPETVGPDMPILEVAELFVHKRFRRLPVVEDDRLVGQISRRDVLGVIDKMDSCE